MNSSNLFRFRKQWDEIKEHIRLEAEIGDTGLDYLAEKPIQFLRLIIQEGKRLSDPADRASFQWLANEVGDTIFRLTREYPDIVLSPCETTPPAIIKHESSTDFSSTFEIHAEPAKRVSRRSVQESGQTSQQHVFYLSSLNAFILMFLLVMAMIFGGGFSITRVVLIRLAPNPNDNEPAEPIPSSTIEPAVSTPQRVLIPSDALPSNSHFPFP